MTDPRDEQFDRQVAVPGCVQSGADVRLSTDDESVEDLQQGSVRVHPIRVGSRRTRRIGDIPVFRPDMAGFRSVRWWR